MMLVPYKMMASVVQPVHLLWSLMFVKLYLNEHTNADIAGVNKQTFC